MQYKPHDYQKTAIRYILENPNCGVFLGLGLGKTSITLTALEELLAGIQVRKPLIVAPKLVTEHTWLDEINKWDHLKGLTLSRIMGDKKKRIAAVHRQADLYAVSRDNIAWLVEYLLSIKKCPFDCLVIDELSSFKNNSSKRFKAVRKIAPRMSRVIGLTATPNPNSYMDLWSQIYLLDKGYRLGRTITSYRQQYFDANYNGFGWSIRPGAAETIQEKLKDICISMSAKDYLTVPERMDVVRTVHLSNQKGYEQFKAEQYMQLEGEEITPMSAGALYAKLTQYCNGFVYNDDKEALHIHNDKLEALLEDYEALNGEPVIVFYRFQADRDAIMGAIPEARPLKTSQDISDWNRGKIKCALAHPASIGHGINLQAGGSNMFWYGLTDSLELYLQAVGRLERQGQEKVVVNRMFVASNTVEEKIANRLAEKNYDMNLFLDAIKEGA